jgi:transposase
VTKPSRYEPGINRTYQDLADHYGFVVLPTRVRKPRDKTSVSYCTSFGLLRGDTIQPCWTRAAPTIALDYLQAWRDVPKPTSKAV